MEFKNFDELIAKVQKNNHIKRVVVVAAHDEHTLEAVFKARKDKIVEPILVGNKSEIKEMLNKLHQNLDDEDIIDTSTDNESAEKAVELINNNKADFIMKGKIQTADLLRVVVSKKSGLRTNKLMSHVAFNEVPSYHKLLITTDGGLVMYPDLEKKKQVLENAVEVLLNIGYDQPKVAVLAAVEKINEKMPESVDAAKLKDMNQNGEIKNCIVEGPISYDLAMSKESAKIKGYNSPVVGNPDILLVPNITTGNILGKSLVYSANAKMAGFITGAKAPIVLTSRGASSEEKYLSIVISAATL